MIGRKVEVTHVCPQREWLRRVAPSAETARGLKNSEGKEYEVVDRLWPPGQGRFGLWNNHEGKLLEYSVLRQRRLDTHPIQPKKCIFL